MGKLLLEPRRFRVASLVNHIEAFGLRSVPIIALINFLVGGIVAQQGVFSSGILARRPSRSISSAF